MVGFGRVKVSLAPRVIALYVCAIVCTTVCIIMCVILWITAWVRPFPKIVGQWLALVETLALCVITQYVCILVCGK